MIDGPPKVVRQPIDLHLDLIQVPLALSTSAHRLHPSAPDLSGEHWNKPVPPVPNSLVADLDTALVEKTFDIPKRECEADVEHDRQTAELRACLEVPERRVLGHAKWLAMRRARLKRSSIDNTTEASNAFRLPQAKFV